MQAVSVDDPGRFRKLLAAAVVGLLLLTAAAGLRSYRALDAARARESELAARIHTAKTDIAALETRIERLADDPITLESLAREELWMAGPGDVVIVLPAGLENPPAPASVPTPAHAR